jgi:hypothetical protein
MFYVLQNESTAALRRVPILLTDAATGTTAQTGVAITNIYPSVNINGGAFAGGAGTVAEAGYGQYYYQFDASEVATLGLAGIHVTAVGCRDYDAICQVAAFNVYSASGVGITAADVWNYDISGVVGAGLAGSQLNVAATGGAGITAGDVWSYVIPGPSDPAETVLANINTNVGNLPSATTIRDSVWNAELTDSAGFVTSPPYASGLMYQSGYGITTVASDVWSYATREITGGLANTVTTITNPVEVSTPAMAGIANTVWSTDISAYVSPSAGFNLTAIADVAGFIDSSISGVPQATWEYDISAVSGAGLAGTQLNIAASGGAGITAGDVSTAVWDSLVIAHGTSGTFGNLVLRSDAPAVTGNITLWNGASINGVYADTYRIDADYNAAIALKDILTGVGSTITGNITGDLSGSVGSVTADVNVSTASMSGIANTVWNTDVSSFTSPSAGFDVHNGAGTAISAFDVWNYTLTSSGQSADTTLGNADDQATGANTNTNSPTLEANIWGYATRTLTSSSAPTAADIWSYAGGRTITGGIVTSVGDKTGYSLSSTQSFNLTGNITGSVSGSVGSVTGSVGSVVSPVLVATASMSGIANTVWTNATRTITGGAVTSVVDPVTVSTASMSGIAGTVWTYTPRTITSGAGATAGDIWTYNIASITASGTAGAVLNDASVSGSVVTIVNGPYRLTSIAEGTDGRIDILADSVQTIQLNCLDGFGQPFNVTGYAAAVNVYDVSGALTVTYTPTVDFASSGIVSFDIDTDVTGTTGRYTLVVELTAGAEVVQLGPLEILVRPL